MINYFFTNLLICLSTFVYIFIVMSFVQNNISLSFGISIIFYLNAVITESKLDNLKNEITNIKNDRKSENLN